MAHAKATVTLDRTKVKTARALVRAKSISQTIDIALDQLIRAEQLRRDVAVYQGKPMTAKELAVADLPVALDLGDEDVDYEGLYGRAKAPAKRSANR
jgi:hypothetical protein